MLISYCEKCKNEVPRPLLTQTDKNEVLAFVRANKKLQAMALLKEKDYMSLYDTKVFVTHLCEAYGKCHNCKYDQLKNEYEICPVCKSLNINYR
jgi:uncharacterized paraquat-inducible protein A